MRAGSRPTCSDAIWANAIRLYAGDIQVGMGSHKKIEPDESKGLNRRTLRIKGCDYSQAGVYFVTVCAYKKQPLFGDIKNGRIKLSEIGQLVNRCWLAIPRHFTNVRCDKFVIMPNYFHGIIVIHEKNTLNVNDNYDASRRGAACCAPTRATSGHPGGFECVAYVRVRHVFVGRRGRPPTTTNSRQAEEPPIRPNANDRMEQTGRSATHKTDEN